MRLTHGRPSIRLVTEPPRLSRAWALIVIVATLSAIFALDATTYEAPVQHLYYLPIVFALHNLRSFEAQLQMMVGAARETGKPLSLLVLDVDRLKSLNDEHGHLAGAEAVRFVGRLLADRLPPHAVACRYGGDEFVVALPESDEREAIAVAEDLGRDVHAAAPVLAGVPHAHGRLSISVGIASRTFDASSASAIESIDHAGEQLFGAADAALYAAKNGGRNRISVASTLQLAGLTCPP